MKIRYLGHSCFELTARSGIKVLTDPYRGVGYELPNGLFADVITVSHGHFDHNYVGGVKAANVVTASEKFEKDGVEIVGIDTYHDPKQGALRGKNIIYKIKMDGIEVCHFGDLGEVYRDDLAKKIGSPDVVLIPVGGTYTIDWQEAKEYADKLSVRLVIPMHFKPKDGTLDIAEIEYFIDQYKSEEIVVCPRGEIDLSKQDLNGRKKQILYMERAK